MTPTRILHRAAWLHLALVPLLVLGLWLDPTQILGVSRWLKPLKFYVSVAIFFFTTAYFLRQLTAAAPARFLAWGIITCLTIENILVTLQAARGVPSHFNFSTPFDSAVFSTMGVVIVINTIFIALLLVHLFRNPLPTLAPAFLWSLRGGALLAILGSLQGFLMVAHRAHSVGAPDGGPGLALLNWSTQSGDLRIAHFFSLHAFQALPLAGYWLAQTKTPRASLLVAILFAAYLGLTGLLLLEALAAKPLFF